jgi:uncharacterized protein YceH (UPF0502 family)
MSISEPRTWVPLSPPERRVLGVLIEKQKTTPDYYPMTIAALVAGCNQKSNRDPITAYDADDVEDALQELRRKGVAVMVEGGGRVVRWKHQAYDWLGLRGRPAEAAVLAELLLRGPQTEGELRQRASRMDPIADLPALQTILNTLNEMGLVVYLTPSGQRRGVIVTHGLCPPEELERVRESLGRQRPCEGFGDEGEASVQARPSWHDEAVSLRRELDALRALVESLADDVRQLKAALGV